jgi:exonuclease SbcC
MFNGLTPEDENAYCSQMLGDIVMGLSAQLSPEIPAVLAAHFTMIGASTEGNKSSVFAKSDVVLPAEAVAASRFDLVCLGHIHVAQKVENWVPTYYCGALNGVTFNEEG